VYCIRPYSRRVAPVLFACASGIAMPAASAQDQPAVEPHQHEAVAPAEDHTQHAAQAGREGSGTAWLPDATPMYALHAQRGAWQLMAHGNVFLQFVREGGDRGDDQLGSINWIMGMAERPAGRGRVQLRTMFSLEPWTIGGCGYPNLLASGERCDGEPIHDRQHPHDLFMELTARYDAPLRGALGWQVYGGPAGEPALGPVAFPHRASAMPNPLAPISHHWLDATHITFGVVTGAVYGGRWKVEASAFNGREPDEGRTDFDLDTLDSASARISWLPGASLAVQASAGWLVEAEAGEHDGVPKDVTRATASATYHRVFPDNRVWASTVAWGRNAEAGDRSDGALVETSLMLADRDTWFGRFEVVEKSAHDLAIVDSADQFTVAKLQAGYTRYLAARRGLQAGVGGSVSAVFVPGGLRAAYGGRASAGFGVFLTIRPAAAR
jgi:hypothetical protein